MASVRSVVDRVGPTLLRDVYSSEDDTPVGDVVIAEPAPPGHLAAGDLVLAVATRDRPELVRLIRECAAHDVAAVLCKPPLAADEKVRRAARAARVGLVEVRQATSWAQLVWVLRTVLDEFADELDARERGDDPGSGELFQLADAAASVVDAPVTIEDTNSRVLAYSARQDLTDPARVSTIMGRRIPDDVLARFRSRGVFRQLSKGKQTIFVPAQQDGTLPRLIVPIRMGGELLGSMWAVVSEPVSEERAAAFADAAPVVAVHLLRRRAHSNAQRRAAAESVRALLEGGVTARRASTRLELADVAHRVVVVDTAGFTAGDTLQGEGLRLALLSRISEGIGHQPVAAELDGLLYAIVPDGHGHGSWSALHAVLAREDTGPLRAAAGEPREISGLAESRAQADEALRLLQRRVLEHRVVSYADVWTAVVLHRAANGSSDAGIAELGPLGRLRAHDAEHGTDYVDTLYEWLRHPGDPRAAARELRVHPNTLRYRMRRVTELGAVEVDDPDVRLALLSQLIALRWT